MADRRPLPQERSEGIRKNTLDIRRVAVVANLQRIARLPQPRALYVLSSLGPSAHSVRRCRPGRPTPAPRRSTSPAASHTARQRRIQLESDVHADIQPMRGRRTATVSRIGLRTVREFEAAHTLAPVRNRSADWSRPRVRSHLSARAWRAARRRRRSDRAVHQSGSRDRAGHNRHRRRPRATGSPRPGDADVRWSQDDRKH